jgi:hypothetical protein
VILNYIYFGQETLRVSRLVYGSRAQAEYRGGKPGFRDSTNGPYMVDAGPEMDPLTWPTLCMTVHPTPRLLIFQSASVFW